MCNYFILTWLLSAGLKFGRKKQIIFYDQIYWAICEVNNSQKTPEKETENRVKYG